MGTLSWLLYGEDAHFWSIFRDVYQVVDISRATYMGLIPRTFVFFNTIYGVHVQLLLFFKDTLKVLYQVGPISCNGYGTKTI